MAAPAQIRTAILAMLDAAYDARNGSVVYRDLQRASIGGFIIKARVQCVPRSTSNQKGSIELRVDWRSET